MLMFGWERSVGGDVITPRHRRGEGPSSRGGRSNFHCCTFLLRRLENGLGLHMQVPDHGIDVPAAEDLDEVHIHFSAQERHGAARAQRASTDLIR
jgi:hypothetical protein